ncbi:MAG TPA: patatin-like phospholipase family protein [Gemmatimonadales bacterium]|nr:patatin-like phospholipase family protein [Gemmatimonadales bacterium]
MIALVLSGGGARAAYQVGVLAALSERLPSLNFPILTGVSAGAINTMSLAAHGGTFADAVDRLRQEWARLTPEQVYRIRPVRLGGAALRWLASTALGRGRGQGPAQVRGMLEMEPLREFLTRAIDIAGVETNLASGRLHAAALTATSYANGESVTFVHGAETIAMWARVGRRAVRTRLTLDHVLASAAIPVVFPAVRLGEEYFGDGSVRRTAPLAPAIHLGARAILAIALHPRAPAAPSAPWLYPSAAETLGLVLNSVFHDALDADAERLERINRHLAVIPQGVAVPDGLVPIELLKVHPSQDLGVLAAGFTRLLPRGVRLVVESLGGERATAVDFVSYLLFDPAYTSRLIDLAYADAQREWPRYEAFLARAGF